jgi:hypothetical protein
MVPDFYIGVQFISTFKRRYATHLILAGRGSPALKGRAKFKRRYASRNLANKESPARENAMSLPDGRATTYNFLLR